MSVHSAHKRQSSPGGIRGHAVPMRISLPLGSKRRWLDRGDKQIKTLSVLGVYLIPSLSAVEPPGYGSIELVRAQFSQTKCYQMSWLFKELLSYARLCSCWNASYRFHIVQGERVILANVSIRTSLVAQEECKWHLCIDVNVRREMEISGIFHTRAAHDSESRRGATWRFVTICKWYKKPQF